MNELVPKTDDEIVQAVCTPRHWTMPFEGYGEPIDSPITAHGWQIEPVYMMDPRIRFAARERIVALKRAGLDIRQIWYGHPDVPELPAPKVEIPKITMPWKEVNGAIGGIAAVIGGAIVAILFAVISDPAVFVLTAGNGSIYLVMSWDERK